MKKTLFTILSSAVAVGAFGQGTIAWQSGQNGAAPVAYSLDGTTQTSTPAGNPAQVPGYGQYYIDFMAAPSGTVLALGANGLPNFTTAWTDLGSISQVKVSAGRSSTTVNVTQNGNLAGTAGNGVEFEVVGWAGTATTWAAEAASPGGSLIGFSGETFNGSQLGALGWVQPTGNPNATPTPILPGAVVLGSGGYAGLVVEPVPEPATIALGGLGAAALLLFRRRK